MEYNQNIHSGEGKDPELWKLAQKRASFKHHLATYLIMNIFFWVIWFFTRHDYSYGDYSYRMHFPWPVWATVGWGIGLLFHFMGAYVYPRNNSVEREYQKLKDRNS